MADRPLPAPLPADLPEDWTSGQIVAPDGADVGLSEQHGYNYQSKQINDAQRAVNQDPRGIGERRHRKYRHRGGWRAYGHGRVPGRAALYHHRN